ncbi:hypothetical protein HRG_006803 [Hirsutella rhossiliensis]|uniref:Uncharacterized protein n=1 Tax=Hirsutella rhossiliensis TaxID=111463 RepID=A0A9P8MT78_9HYPO|nr:uncharacterized protein HRG_06803 [Hirsutella rhossiliensis]KAH0961723.1 hypothetical protein HRG_06803 [Hirsutella rhossiliensis]
MGGRASIRSAKFVAPAISPLCPPFVLTLFFQCELTRWWVETGATQLGSGFYVNIADAKTSLKPSSRPLMKRTPSYSNADNDYGSIPVPNEVNACPPRGFRFALKLAHDDLRAKTNMSAATGSAPGQAADGEHKTVRLLRGKQTGYDVVTGSGLSGSPVFMTYRGHETVVSIQWDLIVVLWPSNPSPDSGSQEKVLEIAATSTKANRQNSQGSGCVSGSLQFIDFRGS